MSLTDARRMWKLAARPGGVHSHDARRLGITGNPSQRAKDIADHVALCTTRESRNGRPGSRYFADSFQPDDAVAVRPNGVEVGGDGPVLPAEADVATERAQPRSASASDLSAAYSWVWDGFWDLVPVEELALP